MMMDAKNASLVMIDYQPRLLPAIRHGQKLVARSVTLGRIAALLEVPVIGASGTVSALMGGACRFAFARVRPARDLSAEPSQPMISVREALSDRTVLVFVIAFFVTNFLVGAGVGGPLTGGGEVAWEAHLGGFVFGFFGLPLFDRATRS